MTENRRIRITDVHTGEGCIQFDEDDGGLRELMGRLRKPPAKSEPPTFFVELKAALRRLLSR
jgi:hypothetical protein